MSAVTTSRLSDQETTIRIVFDGAPYAGKTTAAYSLGEALGGATTTPAEEDGRTVWFDWMTYTGGRHDGKAIRVELVTVPGQDQLADRRRHLVEWADVVVFIADTSAAAFDATEMKFQELQRDLEANAKDAHTVVVANKRDLDDALDLDEVRDRLGLTDSGHLVEGVATDGAGLRQAFIFAVRAALSVGANRPDSTTASELLEQMQQALEVDVETALDDTAPSGDDQAATEPEAEQPGAKSRAKPTPKQSAHQVSNLVDAHLVRDALVADQALVLHSDHWRLLVAVSGGRKTVPLNNGSAAARVAADLRSWGLLDGTVRTEEPWPVAESDDGDEMNAEDVEPAGPGRSNERYRALRELRRNLRRR